MSDILVKIMVEVLFVLALATKQINQGRFSKWRIACGSSHTERDTEKFAMKLLGECDVEAVLQRLDRLTQEEARVTAAHTLEVVHELFDNLKVAMDGAYETLTRVAIDRFIWLVWLDGETSSDNIRRALSMSTLRETDVSPPDHRVAVTMQGMANEINKMKR